MTNTTATTYTKLASRIADLKETIALCTADLRYCNTRDQVQSIYAVIAARKAELAELEGQAVAMADEQKVSELAKVGAIIDEAEQVSTCFSWGIDVLEDSVCVQPALFVHLPDACADAPSPEAALLSAPAPEADRAPSRELAFINRTVSALDDAPMGAHSVYVHWFRIDYGCWLDAEEVVNAGGLADYLESLGLSAADVQELMVQDWDCQDAEGLASRCICNHGGFDWLKLEELLEVDVEPAVLVAGLACGLEPDAIEDAYIGEWGSDEDMAAELWEQGGMLDGVPDVVRSYIDWELVARDMLLGSDVVEANGHYFRAA